MSDFREKAKGAMGGAVEDAADIARDQLDTFKRLDTNVKKVIFGVIALIIAALVAWALWPKSIKVIVTRIVEDNIIEGAMMSNSVIILNHDKFDLGEATIIMNDKYEYVLDGLPTGETLAISVTEFYPKGNPDGPPPEADYVPRKVAIQSANGSMTVNFEKK